MVWERGVLSVCPVFVCVLCRFDCLGERGGGCIYSLNECCNACIFKAQVFVRP